MIRDEKMQDIRPILDLADTDKKPLELFQNNTLRPILKLQHSTTLFLLQQHKNYKPEPLESTSRIHYESYLIKFLQRNIDLKNQLLGTIIGLFTAEEMKFYQEHTKELNKRILQMQLKRFSDTAYPSAPNHYAVFRS